MGPLAIQDRFALPVLDEAPTARGQLVYIGIALVALDVIANTCPSNSHRRSLLWLLSLIRLHQRRRRSPQLIELAQRRFDRNLRRRLPGQVHPMTGRIAQIPHHGENGAPGTIGRRITDHDMVGTLDALLTAFDRQTGGDAVQIRFRRYGPVTGKRLRQPFADRLDQRIAGDRRRHRGKHWLQRPTPFSGVLDLLGRRRRAGAIIGARTEGMRHRGIGQSLCGDAS